MHYNIIFQFILMNPLTSQSIFPLAVIGSKEEILVGNDRVRVRQYPWGIVEGMLRNFVVVEIQLEVNVVFPKCVKM